MGNGSLSDALHDWKSIVGMAGIISEYWRALDSNLPATLDAVHWSSHPRTGPFMKFIGQLLGAHLQRYPGMQLADVYKLLHQAALGAGHAVSNAADARSRLQAEVAGLASGPDEPLVDVISPDGRLARVHLRPYIAADHDLARLADAFARTPEVCPPAPDKLVKFCACLGDLADASGIPFSRTQVAEYFDAIAAQSYPVVRHSQPFRDAYRPAYRVVAIELLAPLQ